MFFFFAVNSLSAQQGPILYPDFINMIWAQHSKSLSDFENTRFIINTQQVADRNISNFNITIVYMTPSEKQSFANGLTLINSTDVQDTDSVYYIKVIEKHRRAKMAHYVEDGIADARDIGTFWIPFVVCILTALTLLGAYIMWSCDRYENDPANSLMFATEGQKLVSGN